MPHVAARGQRQCFGSTDATLVPCTCQDHRIVFPDKIRKDFHMKLILFEGRNPCIGKQQETDDKTKALYFAQAGECGNSVHVPKQRTYTDQRTAMMIELI